jgi:hypothetical protein
MWRKRCATAGPWPTSALDRAGDTEGARTVYQELAELAERTGDPRALANAALGSHSLGFRSGHIATAHLRLMASAADQVPTDDVALRARVLAAYGRDLRLADATTGLTNSRAAAIASEATALARRSGDPSVLAFALLAEHDVIWQYGSAARRLEIVAEMAAQASDPDLIAQTVLLRATALIELGSPNGVAQLHTYTRLADELGHARGRWGALSRRATLAVIAGHAEEAMALSGSAFDLGLLIGQPDVWAVQGTLRLSLCPLGYAPPKSMLDIDPNDPSG